MGFFKDTYTAANNKAATEFSLGTSKPNEYGYKNGRGYIRAVNFEQGKDSQIVMMMDPSELFEISMAMAKVLKTKQRVSACQPHKYQGTLTCLYVDYVERQQQDGQVRTILGFTMMRKNENGGNQHSISVSVSFPKFAFIGHLLKTWSVQAAFTQNDNDMDTHNIGDRNGSSARSTNQDEFPTQDYGMPGPGEFDDIPF